jgi:hypothetical protein
MTYIGLLLRGGWLGQPLGLRARGLLASPISAALCEASDGCCGGQAYIKPLAIEHRASGGRQHG